MIYIKKVLLKEDKLVAWKDEVRWKSSYYSQLKERELVSVVSLSGVVKLKVAPGVLYYTHSTVTWETSVATML